MKFNLFKKKDKKDENTEESQQFVGLEDKRDNYAAEYEAAIRTQKDLFSPSHISVVDEKTLSVGDRVIRNYVLQGYPNHSYVGWLDRLYSFSGDMDTIVYVEPSDARKATDALTAKITDLESQIQLEERRGSIANITKYSQEIARLEQERAKIEMNADSMYHLAIFANMAYKNKEELNKHAEILESNMRGQRMNLMPTALRMISGFVSTLPVADLQYQDKLRNANAGAVVSCFPFYNAEIYHPNGTFFGINASTNTPMFIKLYDDKKIVNTNMSVFGRAGSGKTYLMSCITMRSALQSIHTAIVDPENEYSALALEMGGVNIDISRDSKTMPNMFEIEEFEETDDDGNPTGVIKVGIKDKVADLLDLISVMARGEITQEQRSLVSAVLLDMYDDFGITEDPESLYDGESYYDEKTEEFYNGGKKKQMPTFTDFHNKLLDEINNNNLYESLRPLANQLRMFKKGGPYDLFDCQSSVDTSVFSTAPIINFNVSTLEESVLRPIGMYVAMSFIWEKFVKKNFRIRKRVLCDEAWMLLNKNMEGHEYTSKFLETCARRIRKRNAGLVVASQNFIEFSECTEGKSVLSNSAIRIFLKQSEVDIDAIREEFKLSNGEIDFLRTAETGDFLLKTDTETTVGVSVSTPMEHEVLTTKNRMQKI